MFLADLNQAWFLRAGSAELFVVRHENGTEHSRRSLGLVEAPGCLLGTGAPAIQIEAKLSDDAELEAVPFERLIERPEMLQLFLVDTQVLLAGFAPGGEPLAMPDSLAALRAVQGYYANRLDEGFGDRDRAEIVRQQAKAQHHADALHRASNHLAGVLLPAAPAQTKGSGDPLVSAMRAVGAMQGIAVGAHPMADSFPTLHLRIQATARASRCRIRQVTLSRNWWRTENGPMLAFRGEDNAPVALLPAGAGYRIEDPAGACSGPINREQAAKLSPVAYMLYRGFPERAITWKEMAAFALRSNWTDAILVMAMAVLVGLLGLAIPYATQLIFDYAIPGGLDTQLWQLGAGMLTAALGTAAFSLAQGFLLLRIETKAERDIQSAVIDRLLNLPAPFFRRYSVGDLASRTMSIDAIRQIISGVGITALLGTVASLFNFLILFRHGWQLALLAIGLGLGAILVTAGINLWALRFARALENLEGIINGIVNQFIAGMAKLRVTGSAAQAFAVWAEKFAEKARLRLRMRRIHNLLSVFNVAFAPLATLLIFWFAFQRIAEGLSTGDFLAYTTAFGSFLAAALAFSNATIQALMIIPLYERARPILDQLPEAGAAKAWPGELTGDIDLRHVTFRYDPQGPPVLEDISLMIRPGEFVAVVGPSGSGKSTLLRLLLGFEHPESGAIYYNGQGLDTLDSIEVRRQIGVVLQSSRPLSGDIFTNIASNSGATMEQAWAAADLAGLGADIRAMPMGMHTIVSEEGGGLSGGQRQRLMIARAVVGNPKILFFDEATSALDNETQAHVAAGLAELRATRLVIAHRLSTIAEADRIIVIREGRIVEEGTYAGLMEKRGFFFELANRQLA